MHDGAEADWQVTSGGEFIERCCRNPERYIAAGMVLVRTSMQKAVGHYRAELPHTDDFEMLLRLARRGPVAFTRAVQGIKRMHGANQTDTFLAERTRDLVERLAAIDSFFENEGSSMDEADRLRRLGRRSISERAYWCGMKDLSVRPHERRRSPEAGCRAGSDRRRVPAAELFDADAGRQPGQSGHLLRRLNPRRRARSA